MAKKRLITIGTAALLGFALTAGPAQAATPEHRPAPGAAAPAVPNPGIPAPVAEAPSGEALPVQQLIPGEAPWKSSAIEQNRIVGKKATIASYVQREERAFGFDFTGLKAKDEVTVRWRTVVHTSDVVSTNVYRGTDPAAGKGWWYSGRQPGWTSADVTVTRDGKTIASLQLINPYAVRISDVALCHTFAFLAKNALSGDRMLIEWTMASGEIRQLDLDAGLFLSGWQTGWRTATIKVYEGSNPLNLIANPVTIVNPGYDDEQQKSALRNLVR
ncbi:hypothetical protein SAMN05421595_1777 [Austwickia chelonae]|uniref:Uncharacterized protein n=1 Tax=Austwickia chelonae NBRC 105200 TaxID=1184607 RepID=K6VIT6_9MICO|nr:hypothetical protein [Austwickia chelonae]GAB76644.1 hypothetical protein AUCHE_02_00030 [Austwickia chelonae NBRC 105200]SEW28604.1 hypothetical protein SAMN05421595_1777 [Austwickia chelonae]